MPGMVWTCFTAMKVGVGRIDFDVDGVGAGAGVDAHLIEADGKRAAGVGDDVALGADEEGLREGGIADTADDCAAACGVVGKNANEVFEVAGEAGGVGVSLSVGVVHFAGDGGDDVFAGLNGDAGVDPGLIAGDGDVLRDAAFAGGDVVAVGAADWPAVVVRWWLRMGGAVAAEELRVCDTMAEWRRLRRRRGTQPKQRHRLIQFPLMGVFPLDCL